MSDILVNFINGTGFANITWQQVVVLGIACFFIYLAIAKKYEPYLLIPIAFGMLLANFPVTGIGEEGGLLYILYQGTKYGVYPPLIFLCVGMSTDFGPMIANPMSILLGAAAQFGIFLALIGAVLLGFTGAEAASIASMGGADGPTAIYLTSLLAPHLLGPVALAAYSYMALVPIIQPPIIKLLTKKEDRKIKMEQARGVSKKEKIIFPILVSMIVIMLLPTSAPLVGMLMFGNLVKESEVVPKLVEAGTNSLMYIITIILGLTVGSTAVAETFLSPQTLKIIGLGLFAFSVGTATGVIFGNIMCKLTKGKINPMIGAAGVSAVPMSARVVQKLGQEENPSNFLLMHAMGPNVAGVIGSAVAAGILLNIFG